MDGLTSAQAIAVASVLSLAAPELRQAIAAFVGSKLGPPGVQPFADAAVLNAVGKALVRYAEAT